MRDINLVGSRLQINYCQYGVKPDHDAVQLAIKKKRFWRTCTEMISSADPKDGVIYAGKQQDFGITIKGMDINQLIFVQIPATTTKKCDWVSIGNFNAIS